MHTTYTIGELESFLIAIFVLFIGHSINRHVRVFRQYNIPEPIVGGLVVAAGVAFLHFQNISLDFSLSLQNTLMLMFFSTIGLSANYKLLLSGGKKVFIFLGVASIYIVIQNAVGVSLANLLGLDPIIALSQGQLPCRVAMERASLGHKPLRKTTASTL